MPNKKHFKYMPNKKAKSQIIKLMMSLTRQQAKEIFTDLDVILIDINNDTYNDKYDVYLKLWYKCYWQSIFFHLIFDSNINCGKIDQLKNEKVLIQENHGVKLSLLENDLEHTMWKRVYNTIMYDEYMELSAENLLKQIFKTYFEEIVNDDVTVKSAKILMTAKQ